MPVCVFWRTNLEVTPLTIELMPPLFSPTPTDPLIDPVLLKAPSVPPFTTIAVSEPMMVPLEVLAIDVIAPPPPSATPALGATI